VPLLQDSEQLRRALASVDLPDLLMTYAYLTNDSDLLERMALYMAVTKCATGTPALC